MFYFTRNHDLTQRVTRNKRRTSRNLGNVSNGIENTVRKLRSWSNQLQTQNTPDPANYIHRTCPICSATKK